MNWNCLGHLKFFKCCLSQIWLGPFLNILSQICIKSKNLSGLQLYWKETPTEVFSCEYCEIFENTCFFENNIRVATSDSSYILQKILNKVIQEADWPFVSLGKITLFYLLSFVFICFITRCQLLSFVVTRCTTGCHSLSFVVSVIVIRCHSFYHSSLSLDVQLICLFLNDRSV